MAGGVRRRLGPELRGEGRAPVGLRRGQGDDTRYVHAPSLPDVLAVALVIVAALQLTAAGRRLAGPLVCIFLMRARVLIAELKDDPALDKFDAAMHRIEKLHEKCACFPAAYSLSFHFFR